MHFIIHENYFFRERGSAMTGERNENEIVLCNSLTLRYSVSVSQSAVQYSTTRGYYNNVRFYFYSTALKKQIGKDWRTSYPPTKKSLPCSGEKPGIQKPNRYQIQRALTELLRKNVGISLTQKKMTATGQKQIQLDSDELLIFWLTRYKDFSALDRSIRTDVDRHKAFAKLCTEIGRFRLSSLCTLATRDLYTACDELVSGIKRALNAEKSTSSTNDKTQIVRFAILLYLTEKEIDPAPAMKRIMAMSIPQKSAFAKIADNMRPQSLPIERYRELYEKLENDNSGISKGLQLMLFLGLTSEEVCGLNMEDFQKIPRFFSAYQLCISKAYRNNGKKYELVYDENEEFYRCVPVPFPLYKLFSQTSGHTEKEPLLTYQGRRIRPDELDKELKALLKKENDTVTIEVDGKQKIISLSFLPSSYRASCRYYWHYYSGLTEGEIHYLGAMKAPDTLSKHYVDFSNATEQYRMLKQLEHGIALLLRIELPTRSSFRPLEKKEIVLSGSMDTKAGAVLLIDAPIRLSVSSWRGIQITKEADR